MIKKVAFIYLTQDSGEYYVTDDPGYAIQRRPQLGLQYLCAVLERKGIKTNIFDQTVNNFSFKKLIGELIDYDLVGFYCSDPQEETIKKYCKIIKAKMKIPVIVGGPSTLQNNDFLNYGVDIVVDGEGEITMQEIVDYYNNERELGSITGISYKKDGQIITTPARELVKDLDSLPFPDRSKIDINAYYDWFIFNMKKPYITVLASRGCVNRCTYCTSCKIWQYKYRQRSVDNVLAEIDEAYRKYKIKYVAFQDDIFGLTNEWIEEFCNKLISRPYKIKWMAILYPFTIRKDIRRILKLMKKAGCTTLSFGLQSAHPEILKNIRRSPSEPDQLKKVIAIANKLNFVTAVGFIIGLPGDNLETTKTTIDYSIDCNVTLANYYILSVLHGSEIDKTYQGRPVCELSNKQISDIAKQATRRFYTQPKVILRIIFFVIKNPKWIISIFFKLPSILARIGFINFRKR